jgi:hypothetical protein
LTSTSTHLNTSRLPAFEHIIDGMISDETQVFASRLNATGFWLELVAAQMKVQLLAPECECMTTSFVNYSSKHLRSKVWYNTGPQACVRASWSFAGMRLHNSDWSLYIPFHAFGCEDLVFHPKTSGVEIDRRFYALDCEHDMVDGFDCETCHGELSSTQ